jgi:hypothetical protein
MTIVKHETVELTREDFTIIKKCIKMMMTIKNGADDPVLKHEAHTVALALEQFRTKFTTRANEGEALQEMIEEMAGADVGVQVRTDETTSDYDRGFQDGMQWEHDNPPIRPNY